MGMDQNTPKKGHMGNEGVVFTYLRERHCRKKVRLSKRYSAVPRIRSRFSGLYVGIEVELLVYLGVGSVASVFVCINTCLSK